MKKWEIVTVVVTFVIVIAVALICLLPECQRKSVLSPSPSGEAR